MTEGRSIVSPDVEGLLFEIWRMTMQREALDAFLIDVRVVYEMIVEDDLEGTAHGVALSRALERYDESVRPIS